MQELVFIYILDEKLAEGVSYQSSNCRKILWHFSEESTCPDIPQFQRLVFKYYCQILSEIKNEINPFLTLETGEVENSSAQVLSNPQPNPELP